MTEAIRIAALNFVHETVTFLPNDTTLDDFVHDGSPARGEALLAWEPRPYMGGFVKVAREHAGVEHGTARGAAIQERRHLQVLSARPRPLSSVNDPPPPPNEPII